MVTFQRILCRALVVQTSCGEVSAKTCFSSKYAFALLFRIYGHYFILFCPSFFFKMPFFCPSFFSFSPLRIIVIGHCCSNYCSKCVINNQINTALPQVQPVTVPALCVATHLEEVLPQLQPDLVSCKTNSLKS